LGTCLNGYARQSTPSPSPDLIQQEIDAAIASSRWEVGPFRLSPRLGLGVGYDSNGAYLSESQAQAESESEQPVSDLRAVASPGILATVPLGNRALIWASQDFNVLYYKELDDLRDLLSTTGLGGAVGGRKLIFRLQDRFGKQKTGVTSEFDIPTDQEWNELQGSIGFALGSRHLLDVTYHLSTLRILDEEIEVGGTPVESLLDRDETTYGMVLSRRLSRKTSLIFEGFFERYDFEDDASGRDGDAYGVLGGFSFNPTTNLQGDARLGYKRIIPDVASQADFQGLIGAVNFTVALGERLRPQLLYSRGAVPSVTDNNWYFIENRFGGSLEISLTDWLSVGPGAVVGRNTYPRPSEFENEDGELVREPIADDFQTYSLNFTFRLTGAWSFGIGTSYLLRDSNVPDFNKERWVLNLGITGGI
jgi:hypothetical protein